MVTSIFVSVKYRRDARDSAAAQGGLVLRGRHWADAPAIA